MFNFSRCVSYQILRKKLFSELDMIVAQMFSFVLFQSQPIMRALKSTALSS